MKRTALPLLTALALSACAHGGKGGGGTGDILYYERTNRDGSEKELVAVYLPSPTRVEVVKTRDRCTGAAYVTGTLDPATGNATELVAGRLEPEARQRVIGTLTDDRAKGAITARISMGDKDIVETLPVPDRLWHLYDFDLASLTALPPPGWREGKPFTFGLPVVIAGEGDRLMTYLGRVDARFARRERIAEGDAIRFDATLDREPGVLGPLWLDAKTGRILRVEWTVPNHAEYSDFTLRLVKREQGAAAWRTHLVAHHAGCEGTAAG